MYLSLFLSLSLSSASIYIAYYGRDSFQLISYKCNIVLYSPCSSTKYRGNIDLTMFTSAGKNYQFLLNVEIERGGRRFYEVCKLQIAFLSAVNSDRDLCAYLKVLSRFSESAKRHALPRGIC